MENHRWIFITVVGVVYYALAWYLLFVFDAGIVATALILFGLPALLLGYYSYAPLTVVVSVAVFATGISLILEGTAHVYGLWYSLGAEETRLLSLIPVEVIIASICEITFLVFLYELIFDDGVYNQSHARTRYGAIGVFGIGVVILLFLYTFAESHFFVGYSYLWIVGIIMACSLAALSVFRVYSARFFDRLLHFSLIGAIPSLIALFLSVNNVHRVYANNNEYLSSLIINGESVPIEAVILAFALPFLVATIYELYLDDQS